MFVLHDVNVEDENEVVVLSNTTEVIKAEELGDNDLADPDEVEDEEVNSPAIFPRRTVCCKLFAYTDDGTDRESSTKLGICLVENAPDGTLHVTLEKGRDLPKQPPRRRVLPGPSALPVVNGLPCFGSSPSVSLVLCYCYAVDHLKVILPIIRLPLPN
ncbi:hypothetical protein SASPL_133080 [Salvia splendens]|uniref:Uncharacterized protein n=1 Tax=Salvia splendens TaxID=180675 RepID=A0A8X8X294_SALSN|nr:hypothetical protein SASPL_133080 [Salvia splendens]